MVSVAFQAPRPPSYADITALPDNVVGEILGGELIVSPRPALPHARASTVLTVQLGGPFDLGIGGPGGWWILDEPELSLAVDPRYDPVVPDLAGWRRDIVATVPLTPQHHDVPQWICEVLSPTTRRIDRLLKVPFYARAGVAHLWLLDPLDQTLEALELTGDRWVLLGTWGGDVKVRIPPFDALELDLAPLWERGAATEGATPAEDESR